MYVYFGLGTNEGDRAANLRLAVAAIVGEVIETVDDLAQSLVYESAPMYVTDQPRFLNMVVAGTVADAIAPPELLRRVKAIEARLGRDLSARAMRYGPRPIDIDIEMIIRAKGAQGMGDHIVVATPELTIPHPRLAERAFVLYPLRDIAPDLIHPTLGKRVAELAEEITGQDLRQVGRL